MSDLFFLAWRYLVYHRGKSCLLAAGLTVAVSLPWIVHGAVELLEEEMFRRAESTPVVIGARGSRFDLALHALNFRAVAPGVLPQRERFEIAGEPGLRVVPLHVRFTARGFPVVGTTLDYFDFRNLRIAEGHGLVRLGDCVVGARVARELGLRPGDYLPSDRTNFFDLAGNQPLEMRVTGILQPSDSPDDLAVFVDLRTAWVLEGIGHGHQDVADGLEEEWIVEREDATVRTAPVVPTHQRITDENLPSFHFHGDPNDFPLTALLVEPEEERSRALLLGRYVADDALYQAIRPPLVIAELMDMVVRLKRLFDWHHLFLVGVTALFVGLVMMLSLRLRRAEAETMFYLGCGRGTIFILQGLELLLLLLLALVLAFGTTQVAVWWLADWIRTLAG